MKKILILLTLIISFVFGHIEEVNKNIVLTDIEKEFIKNNSVIKVGVESDWPPFDFVEDGEYKGLARDYLDHISELTNIKFQFHIDKWENLLLKAKNKELDLLPALSVNKQREEFLLFTNSYLNVRDYIFTKTTNKDDYSDLTKIKSQTVAIPAGYIQISFFKERFPNIKIYETKNLLDSIDAVVTNKADFLVSNVAIINYLTKKYNISGIRAANHVIGYKGNKLHMAVRDDYEILRGIIQKALNVISFDKKNHIAVKWMNFADNSSSKKVSQELIFTNEEKNYIKNKKKIVIANEFDWIPYDYYENGVPKGYIIDYIKIISQKTGLDVKFVTDKWSSLMKRFKDNEIDILPVISYNKDREKFLNYTHSILPQEMTIVTKSTVNTIINLDDLKNKKVGMIKGFNTTKKLQKYYPQLNVIEFDAIEDILDSINNGFIDATIQNDLLAKYYINKKYNGYLKIVSKVKLRNYDGLLYMGIQEEDPVLLNIINKAINSISKEELNRLNNKWISFDKQLNFTEIEKAFINNTLVKSISTNTWAPFNFDDKGEVKGISIDFWNLIVNKAQLNVEHEIVEKFSTSLDKIKNKTTDVSISATKTKEREEYSIFTDSYTITPIGIATLQDKNYIKNAKKLMGKKVAVGKNFSAHLLLKEKYPEMDFYFVNSVYEGLEALSKDDVFAYVDIMPVLTYNIKRYGFTNIKVSGDTGIDYNLRFMIRDDYEHLKSIINKTLASISYEEKEKIFDKWLKVEIEDRFDYALLWKIVIMFVLVLLFVLYKNRQLKEYQKKLERTQKELQNSLDNTKALIDFNIAGILIIQNSKVVYSNDEAVNILKYQRKSQLEDKNINEVVEIKNNNDFFELMNEAVEYNAFKADGTLLPIVLKSKEIMFFNKKSFILSIVDLSEVKKNEELMSQQSKMASLGEMIGNIAHQWRQPLSSISTTASGIKLQKEFDQLTDEKLNEHLDGIISTTKFLSQTIDDFRNYIKKDKMKKEFKVSDNIEKVLSIMKGSFINHFIHIQKDIEDNILFGYENELNQVLLNILSNSKDALKNINENDRYIKINSYKKDNNVIIQVIDSGGGISEDIVKKVFEPYFTTKHKSQGTGLGLYMTHKIISESMNGSISIENCKFDRFEKCTKVEIQIPIG